MKETNKRALLRNFVIELAIYGTMVTVYSIVVLRVLGDPLSRLFDSNLGTYALVSLVLIVVQGVVLDAITSFLLNQLRLGQME